MYSRTLESIISKKINRGKAIIVVGARQVGKTTLIQKVLENKDYSKALKWYRTAISAQPSVLENYVNVVNIYIAQNNLNKAMSALKQMKKHTTDPKILKEIDDNIKNLGSIMKKDPR